jgi:hypothetical protein
MKLLRLETFTFSGATLSDINIVLCYVLSQYPSDLILLTKMSDKSNNQDQVSSNAGPSKAYCFKGLGHEKELKKFAEIIKSRSK